MIGFVFKFTISFVISYIILSFNFSNRPLFYHLTKFTGPVGKDIQKSIGNSFERTYTKSKQLSSQLFNGSKPSVLDDSVKSKQSSIKKKKIYEKSSHLIQEELRRDEKMKLDNLIKKD